MIKNLLSGVLPLCLILLLTSCANEVSSPQIGVCEIPDRHLLPVPIPKAQGTNNKSLLFWGIALSEEIDKANVRLGEARRYKEKCRAERR